MQGKAHVTTNNGAQVEYVVDGKNGLLVPPDNQYALADAIQKLIDDPATRTRLGAQAMRDFHQSLNYDRFYNDVTTIYQTLKRRTIGVK